MEIAYQMSKLIPQSAAAWSLRVLPTVREGRIICGRQAISTERASPDTLVILMETSGPVTSLARFLGFSLPGLTEIEGIEVNKEGVIHGRCVLTAQSCVTLCDPMQLLWPWDFPGKNTGVGYQVSGAKCPVSSGTLMCTRH